MVGIYHGANAVDSRMRWQGIARSHRLTCTGIMLWWCAWSPTCPLLCDAVILRSARC